MCVYTHIHIYKIYIYYRCIHTYICSPLGIMFVIESFVREPREGSLDMNTATIRLFTLPLKKIP